MSTVFCQKLQKELPALTRSVYPGEIGQRIQAQISEEAWKAWLKHQVLLINEYRLDVMEDEAQTFLEQEMEKFLFSTEGSAKPEGYQD